MTWLERFEEMFSNLEWGDRKSQSNGTRQFSAPSVACFDSNHFNFYICLIIENAWHTNTGPSSEVYIWDLSKHSSIPSDPATPNPQVICRGHTGEGYGLAWCGIAGDENKGRLVTCAEDKTVRLWNVASALKEGKNGTVVSPEATLTHHTDVVEDVDWHNRDINIVGSCGDDKMVCLWDVRESKRNKPIHVIEEAHKGDVNSLEFHPINEFLLATGGSDKLVKLWDMRNLKR